MKRKLLLSILSIGLLSTFALTSCDNSNQTQSSSVGNSNQDSEVYTDTDGTDGLVYELNGTQDGYIVSDCLTVETDIKIPELYNGLPVREIGEAAFRYSTIDSLSLPRSLRKIGNEAFLNIEDDSLLESIVIPEGVEVIEDKAFYYCPTIKEITLPSTLKTLGIRVFGLSKNLSKFHLDESNYFCVEGNVLFNKDKTELICYPQGVKNTTYDVPNSVVSISESAFYGNTYLTGISLGSNVTTIKERGLAALQNLSNLSMSKAPLTTLGDKAFSENGSLAMLSLPASVTSMGEGLFSKCSSLLTVNFANSLRILPASTFYGCSKLSTISLPNELEEIGESAFYGCNSLTSIKLPTSVKRVGDSAFCGAMKLKTVNLPEGLISIGEGAFSNCEVLQSVTFPSTLENLGARAFNRCELLPKLDLSNTKITSIGNATFMDCDAVTEILFPNTLKSIDENAFKNLHNITHIEFNDGLESIGTFAFYGWKQLAKVYIPSSVTTIGSAAFTSIVQERATLNLYFEAESFDGEISISEENVHYSVTRAEYEAL